MFFHFPPVPTWRLSPERGRPNTEQQLWVAALRGSWREHQLCHRSPTVPITLRAWLRGSGGKFLLDTTESVGDPQTKQMSGTDGGGQKPTPQRCQLRSDRSISHSLLQPETPRAYVRQQDEEEQGHSPKISSVKDLLLYAEEMWE